MNLNLIQRAVDNLAGRRVFVRFTAPCRSDARGVCYIDLKGQARIDILPGQSDPTLLDTICHEAAHLRLGHANKGNFAELPSGFFNDAAVNQAAQLHPRESQAVRLAAVWKDYAEYYRWNYWGDNLDWLGSRLAALADCPDPSEQAIKRFLEARK